MKLGILKWQRSVIDALVSERPRCHSSVAALIPVLVKHADADGEKVHPSQATMAREAGLHSETVRTALKWLQDRGHLEHVRNRARGLHEYRLQIADSRPSASPRIGDDLSSDRGSVRGSVRGYKTTIGVTPVSPLEDINDRESDGCANCDRPVGHDPDCAYRPFATVEDFLQAHPLEQQRHVS